MDKEDTCLYQRLSVESTHTASIGGGQALIMNSLVLYLFVYIEYKHSYSVVTYGAEHWFRETQILSK